MRKIVTLFIMISIVTIASAKEVTLKHNTLSLNGNFTQMENWEEKPVLLITHGTLFHNASELITNLQELFAENDISSLAINLSLGLDNRHGAYDCATSHTHKHEDAINEITVWNDWLKKQGAKNVIVVGHSRGGNQTAWFTAEHKASNVSKVILIAPQLWSPEYAKKGYKNRYNKDLDEVLKKAQSLVDKNSPQSMLNPIDFIYCKDTQATAESFVSYYKNDLRKDTIYLLPKINKPVLIFSGTEDTVVKNLDKELTKKLSQDNIQLEVLEGADHSFRDLYTEEIVEISVEFINEKP